MKVFPVQIFPVKLWTGSQVLCFLVVGLSGQCWSEYGQGNSCQPDWIVACILQSPGAPWETTLGKVSGCSVSFAPLFCLHPWGQKKGLERVKRWRKQNKCFFFTLLTGFAVLCKRVNAFCYRLWVLDWWMFSIFLSSGRERGRSFPYMFPISSFDWL